MKLVFELSEAQPFVHGYVKLEATMSSSHWTSRMVMAGTPRKLSSNQRRSWRQNGPTCLTISCPCGPCSPWQRVRADKQALAQERALWHPVLLWAKRMVKKQRSLGGYSLLETFGHQWDRKLSWNLEDGPALHDDDADFYQRVELCQYGLRDQESSLPVGSPRPAGIGADSTRRFERY
eukprot:s2729_g6.t1